MRYVTVPDGCDRARTQLWCLEMFYRERDVRGPRRPPPSIGGAGGCVRSVQGAARVYKAQRVGTSAAAAALRRRGGGDTADKLSLCWVNSLTD